MQELTCEGEHENHGNCVLDVESLCLCRVLCVCVCVWVCVGVCVYVCVCVYV